MRSFLFGAKAGIHILDLEQTARALNAVLPVIQQFAREGKVILFVSTKAQTKEILPEIIGPTGMPYMTVRWPGGFITNFRTMKRRIQYRAQLEKELVDPEMAKRYTKKERLMKSRELQKLNFLFAGTKDLLTPPDAVFVVDTVHDRIALHEARVAKLPVFAFCDTNSDPEIVTFPIPANDDAVKSVRLLLSLIAEAIALGRKEKPKEETAAAAPRAASPADRLQVPAEAIAEKDAAAKPPVRRAPTKNS